MNKKSFKGAIRGKLQGNFLKAAALSTFILAAAPGFADRTSLYAKSDTIVQDMSVNGSQRGTTQLILKLTGTNLTKAQSIRLKKLGFKLYRHLPIINSVAGSVPTSNLNRLARESFIENISWDAKVKKTDFFTDNHSMASAAWTNIPNLDPSRVLVGVVDSGVNAVPDLPNLFKSISFVSGSTRTDDENGHGTHVAGIIAGNGKSSRGPGYFQTYQGVGYNPASTKTPMIASLKVLGPDGSGKVSDVIAGMQWLILVSKGQSSLNLLLPSNVRCVLNLSIGHPIAESYRTDPLCQACEKAWGAGVVVVCAAGNNGRIQNTVDNSLNNEGYGTNYGSINSPANDPLVITVGAMKNLNGSRSDDQVATYSSRGPTRLDFVMKPDIMAPGNRVVSLDSSASTQPANWGYLRRNYSENLVNSNNYYSSSGFLMAKPPIPAYFMLSGTSMATPVVSAAAAMLLANDPQATPDTVKARLMLTADKWMQTNGGGDPCTFGAGFLNVDSALRSSIVATVSAASPSLAQDANGNVYVNFDPALWGPDINGNRALWGINGIYDYRAMWGDRAMWGTSTDILDASRAMWGSAIWSDRAMWGVDTFNADFSRNVIQGE